jgi:hypothetical protein
MGGPGNVQSPGCTVHCQVVPATFPAQLQLFDNVISRVRSIGNSTDKQKTAKQYERFQDATAFSRLRYSQIYQFGWKVAIGQYVETTLVMDKDYSGASSTSQMTQWSPA